MIKYFYIVFLLVVLLTASASAQNFESGAFIAPVFKYTRLINQSAFVTGIKAGWIINKKFVLGAGYYVSTSNVKTPYVDEQNNQNVMMNFNYGGLEFEYLLLNDGRFNLSLDMLLAGGGEEFYIRDKSKNYGSANLLVWEPQLNLEIKLYSWLHADAGVSYRKVSNNYVLYNVSKNDLQGLNILLTFKIGKY